VGLFSRKDIRESLKMQNASNTEIIVEKEMGAPLAGGGGYVDSITCEENLSSTTFSKEGASSDSTTMRVRDRQQAIGEPCAING